jgi:hypothetical protein
MAPCIDSLGGEASEDEGKLLGYLPSLGEDWNGGGGRRPWRSRVRELTGNRRRGRERRKEGEGERARETVAGGLIPWRAHGGGAHLLGEDRRWPQRHRAAWLQEDDNRGGLSGLGLVGLVSAALTGR